jgi:hypothetical protein
MGWVSSAFRMQNPVFQMLGRFRRGRRFRILTPDDDFTRECLDVAANNRPRLLGVR